MTSFGIYFANPWLLLLLIPAGLLTLIPHLRLNKKYRRTRNRIVSMALHLVVMVLSIAVFSGMTIEYDVNNEESEVILLVDASYSNEKSAQKREEFIQAVIESADPDFKLGIVTFGYDQVYAVELTHNMSSVYPTYSKAPSPNITATDIEAALNYTSTLFTTPEAGRIVLVSDAVETDGDALGAIKYVAGKGIKVDTALFAEDLGGDYEVQIVGIETPNEKIKVGDNFEIAVNLESSYVGDAELTVYDNGEAGTPIKIKLADGEGYVKIPFSFALPGMHKLSFELTAGEDTIVQNNEYNSYIYLEVFDKVLVIESITDESSSLCEMLNDELKVTVLNVDDKENMPKTVDELRMFDEIILCNVSNDDLRGISKNIFGEEAYEKNKDSFAEMLYTYVHDFGGGLFTVCGNEDDGNPNDEKWTANAYDRKDMFGSIYQEMLPVEIINYTPPVAVMIIIDSSGSMHDPANVEGYETSKLYYAKQGAQASLDALSERDYVGIMSLSDTYVEYLELTPRPQRDKIIAAIEEVGGGGGTIFSSSIERAGKALSALTNVEKRHIIIVTDGEPASDDEERYEYWLEENAKLGITTSIVGIGCTPSGANKMKDALVKHAGMTEDNFYNVANEDVQKIPTLMYEDLKAPEIKEVNYTQFQPTIATHTSITQGIKEEDIPTLDGFYGVKIKEGAKTILAGPYTPIYSQWQFGKGTVGTFACDLNGSWSSDFVGDDVANSIINNIIIALFPAENIRPKDIDLTISGENYSTEMSVFTELEEGQSIEVTITSPLAEGELEPRVQTITAGFGDFYSRMSFSVLCPGVHEIVARKLDSEGEEISSTTIYKALPYSLEYRVFNDPKVAKALMESLSVESGGEIIENPWEVFENAASSIHKVIDPKIAFIIIVLILFLLDIAVRKFKWKWPHEIVRERKLRKSGSAK